MFIVVVAVVADVVVVDVDFAITLHFICFVHRCGAPQHSSIAVYE